MTAMLQTTHCTISSLTPIHIGCGEDYYPTNYVIKEEALHHFSAEGMIQALSLAERNALATKAMQKGADGLKALQAGIYANSDTLIEQATHSVPVTEAMEQFYQSRVGKVAQHEKQGRKIQNILEIQRHAYNPYTQQPYIAGSGIKGAIRTALLDQLNDHKDHNFDENSSAPRHAGEQLQKELIGYQNITDDPFRLLKVSDAPYQHPDELNGLEIRFIVNRKKQQRKKMESQGMPLKMECMPANRSKSLAFDIGFLASTGQSIPQISDIKQLVDICNAYYLPQLENEFRLLHELNYVNPEWLQQVQNLLDGEIGSAIAKQQVFLLRLGKQAGAESKTVEGARHIKIMQGKGTPAKYQDHTTTIWMAADDKDQQHNLLPLGWVLVELADADLSRTHQFLKDNAHADYQRQVAEQQRQAEIQQKKAEQTQKDAEYAEQERIKEQQVVQKAAKKSSMTESQLAIYELEQQYLQVKEKNLIEPQGTLRQQLTATIKHAENWSSDDKQALLLIAQPLVDFWGLKKNKKLKDQLKTLQP
jgi:CRISPR-associated protein Csm5